MYWTGIKTYLRLHRNLRSPLEKLRADQFRKLRELVEYAYHHVPFYRQLFNGAGFSPDLLKIPQNIRRIPTTRKALFQQAPAEEVISDQCHIEKLVRKRTSGSSGSPLNVYYTPEDRIYRTLLHLRILFHNGMRWRDQMAHISDSRHAADWRYGFQKLGFLPKEFVYAADSTQRQLEALTAINPAVIYSYASSMALLASEAESRGASPIHPKLIFTTGELLTENDRERINRIFSTQVRDIFGIVEMGDVAWQCAAQNGYHLNLDSFFIEIDAGGAEAEVGASGRLIITNLHSFAMPFIRYDVGDLLSAPEDQPCECGCTFPRAQVLQGRADDWLYSTAGQRVSPLIFVIASVPGVQQYRMIQKSFDHLVVEIVPGRDYSSATLKKIEEHVRDVLGRDLKAEVVPVQEIPKDPSGKMRRVVSQIKSS